MIKGPVQTDVPESADRRAAGAAGASHGPGYCEVWWRVAAMAGVLAAFSGGLWYGQRLEQSRQPWLRERLLSTALDSVRVNFLDSLPEGELMRRAVSGMLRELHDPYAALLETAGVNSYRGTLRGESQGLGLVLRLRGPSVQVRRVLAGSPAARAGIRPGDMVVSVDGRRASEAWHTPRPAAATASAAGALSDTLRIELVRLTSRDTVSVGIVASSWRPAAVTEAVMVADGVGYVTLASCATGSADALEQAVDRLVDRGARSLVLDLRGNMGGLYDEGVKAASLFLSRGDVVASLDRRSSTERQEQTVRRSRWPTMPLVVLVDASTASSAELIAAALRDHGRALLVGDHTYGKGLVQRVVNINPELSLRLTTARWLPPSGEPLVRREEIGGRVTGGLTPDVLIATASRIDPSAVPASLSPLAARTLSETVDAIVSRAMLDGSSLAPLPVLERRLRDSLSSALARLDMTPDRRLSLLGDGTRVAMRRLLEMTRGDEALWSYAASDDPGLRAALDVAAPGHGFAAVLEPAPLDVESGGGAQGDSASLAQLEAWTRARFVASEMRRDTMLAHATALLRPAARIGGSLRRSSSDPVVALHFGPEPFQPSHALGHRVLLADPSGAATSFDATVVARLAFRAPTTPGADPTRRDGWRHGWAYLVQMPPKTAAAHTAGFIGWRIVAAPMVASKPPRVTRERGANGSALER